jgi:oxygen-independent coproporphyrinogen-3 oxidase
LTSPNDVIDALYCHVPFCHSICPFCPFAVHGDKAALHAPYLRAIIREIALRGAEYAPSGSALRSVYFGGGTPSALSLEELAQILAALREHFAIASGAEIAIECNPEDIRPEYLLGLQGLGVTRLSLGLQSLHDETLRALGRRHNAEQGRSAWECIRRLGPANYNLDLMFGAPRISPEPFREDLDAVLVLSPTHISLYGLDVEPGTLFGRNPAIHDWHEGHREQQAESYLYAVDRLKRAGYRHYEVSNFCREGREGLQNRIVWDGGNYLGFGPGAHSHVDGHRWSNQRHLPAYARAVQSELSPVDREERLEPVQRANEALMLSLRRDTGLDVPAWETRHGQTWGDARRRVTESLVRTGQAGWDGRRLVLTPAGLLVADAVAERLMAS